jgi:hypothetical protein
MQGARRILTSFASSLPWTLLDSYYCSVGMASHDYGKMADALPVSCVTIEKQLRYLPQGIGELHFDALAQSFKNPTMTISAGLLILVES